jgi:hypothetical protein
MRRDCSERNDVARMTKTRRSLPTRDATCGKRKLKGFVMTSPSELGAGGEDFTAPGGEKVEIDA